MHAGAPPIPPKDEGEDVARLEFMKKFMCMVQSMVKFYAMFRAGTGVIVPPYIRQYIDEDRGTLLTIKGVLTDKLFSKQDLSWDELYFSRIESFYLFTNTQWGVCIQYVRAGMTLFLYLVTLLDTAFSTSTRTAAASSSSPSAANVLTNFKRDLVALWNSVKITNNLGGFFDKDATTGEIAKYFLAAYSNFTPGSEFHVSKPNYNALIDLMKELTCGFFERACLIVARYHVQYNAVNPSSIITGQTNWLKLVGGQNGTDEALMQGGEAAFRVMKVHLENINKIYQLMKARVGDMAFIQTSIKTSDSLSKLGEKIGKALAAAHPKLGGTYAINRMKAVTYILKKELEDLPIVRAFMTNVTQYNTAVEFQLLSALHGNIDSVRAQIVAKLDAFAAHPNKYVVKSHAAYETALGQLRDAYKSLGSHSAKKAVYDGFRQSRERDDYLKNNPDLNTVLEDVKQCEAREERAFKDFEEDLSARMFPLCVDRLGKILPAYDAIKSIKENFDIVVTTWYQYRNVEGLKDVLSFSSSLHAYTAKLQEETELKWEVKDMVARIYTKNGAALDNTYTTKNLATIPQVFGRGGLSAEAALRALDGYVRENYLGDRLKDTLLGFITSRYYSNVNNNLVYG